MLREMLDYYRARAPEYDEWFERAGRYDRGDDQRSRWKAEVAQVAEWLAAARLEGDVLELAGGTGWWTERLAAGADTRTVVDAAPEAVALNRRRVGRSDVRYIVHDLFAWAPDRTYDAVFFSFWLSHVPAVEFDAFWAMVRRALRPGGRAVFIDSLATPTSGATGAPPVVDAHDRTMRTLNDGRTFTIVKVFYDVDELRERLRRLGWVAEIARTDEYFFHGTAVAADESTAWETD